MKKYLLLIFVCLSFSSLSAAKNQPISKEHLHKRFFDALYSTNKTEIFLKNLSLRGELKTELQNHLKKSSKKSYKVRKISPTAFELLLNNRHWIQFDMGHDGGIKIGKQLIKWSSKKTIVENLEEISRVINSESSENKSAWILLPQAHAEPYNPDEVVIGAVGAVFDSTFSMTLFLDNAESFCETGNVTPAKQIGLSLNKQTVKETYGNKEWVRRRFFEARNEMVYYSWGEYLAHPNWRYHDKAFERFYKVQDCFVTKGYIRSSETGEHPANPPAAAQ